ncbi:hypothetical protein AB0C13_36280 [Streptomyces sp. NPDC049099]|uniref:hypothetical protein n=1 Tax=Streptomyces sp. NPDC049099 TaxID=3155768 RepID=UPI003435926D
MALQLSPQERELLISRAKRPEGAAEAARQERAERMVRAAILAHQPFAGLGLKVEAKGSYPNNTKVPGDSDVDIKVQLDDPFYADLHPGMGWWRRRQLVDYRGPWTPDALRREVAAALRAYFAGPIGTDHSIAFYIPEVPGSRPSADVVPCFRYLRYKDPQALTFDQGSVVYSRDGTEIVNWPDEQLRNGRAKNTRTGGRYKFVVRVLKTVENHLADQDVIKPLPSYFSECLVFNVPDDVIATGDFDDAVRNSLDYLAGDLNYWFGYYRRMVEPNELKKVFGEGQKWTARDGRDLVQAAQTYLNYR